MKKCFILGLNTSVQDSPFLSTLEIYKRVGHNTGNLAFHYAINLHLGGKVESIPWSTDITRINQAGEMLIFPAANQVGKHTDVSGLAKKFKEINLPIVAIGLGAQAGINKEIPEIPSGTIDWIKEISKRSVSTHPNIGLRGKFTYDVLSHYGVADKCEILGCPTLFISPEANLGRKIEKSIRFPTRVAVTSGNQNWKHLSKIEKSLAQIVTDTNGSYIGQSPLQMIELTRGEAHLLPEDELLKCKKFINPEMDSEEFINWTKIHGNVFFDIPSWMEHYRHFDFVIGTRIHGVMLALQAGTPAMCIAHDSRTVELCETMHVPYITSNLVSSGFTLKEIFENLKFNGNEFDSNRVKLAANYQKFLENNQINSSAHLTSIN